MATASEAVRTRLILNAHAFRGRARGTASLLRAVVQRHPAADGAPTEYPGHATTLAGQAAQDGCAVVAAIGGDGTVHELANGLMQAPAERRPLLGSVPVGSGNGFSVCMGVTQDPEVAMPRVSSGSVRWADLGLAIKAQVASSTSPTPWGSASTPTSHSIPIGSPS